MPNKNHPLPPEHYRRLINLPLSSKHTLPSLKYLPHSLLYLFKSIPFPWENIKYVKVRYHHKNILTFVQDKTRVTDYQNKWKFIFNEISTKQTHILSFPIYDDNHPLINYEDIVNYPLPTPFNISTNTDSNYKGVNERDIKKGVNKYSSLESVNKYTNYKGVNERDIEKGVNKYSSLEGV
ncbi:pre-mRNA-processing-splicing factor 8, partial [Hamiltosporidium tvaerminnensis]